MLGVDELMPIGRFAALTDLSPKALRLYQDQGILEPAVVDTDSGYRYYSVSQLDVAARIALLRRAGIGLVDVAQFVRAPSSALIRRWRDELDAELAQRRRLLDHLARLTDDQEIVTVTTPTSTTARLQRGVPVLPSLDLERTQRFYADRLGFDALFTYPDYAISARDDVELHFWLTDDADLPRSSSCYVRVVGIDALYAELLASDVIHPNGALEQKPWGVKEFGVLDGDGNLLKFGELVPEP